jgi:hypothetical protein
MGVLHFSYTVHRSFNQRIAKSIGKAGSDSVILYTPSIVHLLAEENSEKCLIEYIYSVAFIQLVNLAAIHVNLGSSLNVKLARKYIASYVAA